VSVTHEDRAAPGSQTIAPYSLTAIVVHP